MPAFPLPTKAQQSKSRRFVPPVAVWYDQKQPVVANVLDVLNSIRYLNFYVLATP